VIITRRPILLLAALTCCLGAVPAAGARAHAQSPARAAPASELVAIALDGVIYALSQNGGPPRRLTSGHAADEPRMSPDGRLIAYLTAGRALDAAKRPRTHDVWVVPVTGAGNGSSARRLTAPGSLVDRGGLSWSPDSRTLAYYQGRRVIVSNADGSNAHVALRLTVPATAADTLPAESPIAWAPDSRRIAVALPATETVRPPSTLRVVTVASGGGAPTTSTARFAAGVLGRPSPLGSYPVGDGLAWTPDGGHLTFATVHNGAGWGLTGVWQVAVSGGVAHLLVGNPAGVAGTRPPSPAMGPSTQVAWSPDGRRLALDPANQLWVADRSTRVGRFYNLAIPGQCRLAQFAWLSPTRLGYVTLCVVPGPATTTKSAANSPIYELSLFRLDLGTTTPRLLLRVRDRSEFALSLSPQYQCIGCG